MGGNSEVCKHAVNAVLVSLMDDVVVDPPEVAPYESKPVVVRLVGDRIAVAVE